MVRWTSNLSALKELFPPSIEEMKKRKNSSTSTTPMKRQKNSNEQDDDNATSQDDFYNITLQDDPDNNTFEDYDEKENNVCDDWITVLLTISELISFLLISIGYFLLIMYVQE